MEKFTSLADTLGVQDPIHPERPVAEPPPAEQTVEDFCKSILRSQEYRESIMRRVVTDDLPPAIEAMLWDRAHGKIKDQVSLSGRVTVTRVIREIVDAAVDDEEDDVKNVVH